MGVDASSTYYYDATSGGLVAIVGYGPIGGVQCVGPSNFVVPGCDVSQFVDVSCADQ
jgi:hypothetical protein